MRVLYLVPDLFGPPSGIARYCRMVCLALRSSYAGSASRHDGDNSVESVTGNLPTHDLRVISLLDAEEARRKARASMRGLKYLSCGGNRAKFAHRALRALAWRPDLILVGHPNFAPLGWLLARLAGAKIAAFIYGIDAWEPLTLTRRRALGACDVILSISRFTAHRAAQENGISLDKVRILHNCLDPASPPSVPSAPSAPSLLTVARINRSEGYKGHDVVMRALPEMLREFPDLRYNIVGDGDGRAALEDLAHQLGVDGAARFHGVVSEEDLARLYREASAFVMPSRGEGFGFVFIEAMQQGTPAIGGTEDATPEVIVDAETGFLVDPTSPEEVAGAAGRLLRDDSLRVRMGRAAQAHTHSQFGFEKFRCTLLQHIDELG